MSLLKQLKASMPQTCVCLLKMIPRLWFSVVFWLHEKMLFKEAKEADTVNKRHSIIVFQLLKLKLCGLQSYFRIVY